MGLRYEFDISELEEAFADAERALARHMPTALALAADLVVAEAKQTHEYKDRTSALTNSIMADEVQGTFASGLSVEVGTSAAHGIYVHDGTKAHEIKPRFKKSLRWPVSGGFAFAKSVKHPGTKADPFLENALEARGDAIENALEGGMALAFEDAGFEVD